MPTHRQSLLSAAWVLGSLAALVAGIVVLWNGQSVMGGAAIAAGFIGLLAVVLFAFR
jgi:hypothetical protein